MSAQDRQRKAERFLLPLIGVLVGIVGTAGFNYLAEERQAHREQLQITATQMNDLRQASRLVDDDLLSAYVTLEELKKGRLGIGNFTHGNLWPYSKYLPVGAWKEQRAVLARYLPRQAWLKVSLAFSDIETLPEVFQELSDSDKKVMPKDVARFLTELYADICEARTLLTPKVLSSFI